MLLPARVLPIGSLPGWTLLGEDWEGGQEEKRQENQGACPTSPHDGFLSEASMNPLNTGLVQRCGGERRPIIQPYWELEDRISTAHGQIDRCLWSKPGNGPFKLHLGCYSFAANGEDQVPVIDPTSRSQDLSGQGRSRR